MALLHAPSHANGMPMLELRFQYPREQASSLLDESSPETFGDLVPSAEHLPLKHLLVAASCGSWLTGSKSVTQLMDSIGFASTFQGQVCSTMPLQKCRYDNLNGAVLICSGPKAFAERVSDMSQHVSSPCL